MNKQLMMQKLKATAFNMMSNKGSENVQEVCPISIINFDKWEWAQGVGLYGLFNYYKQTKDKEMLDVLIKWYDARLKEGLPYKNVNTMAPMLTLACLYEETKNPDYVDVLTEWANWVMDEMPRTIEGGLQHICSGCENHNQIWDDTLFMTVLFLAKYGMLFDRQDMVEESKYQFLIHIKYLYDTKTGLWYHGWNFNNRDNFGSILWGRGNCWITVGICDYLEMTGIDGGLKKYLANTLKAQVDALVKYQCESGAWNTIINDPTSYEEISATAGFGCGILMGIRIGLLDKDAYLPCALKALNVVMDNINEDGTVEQVSYGTGMGNTAQEYKDIPICYMAYGNALAIMILNEGLKL